MPTGQLFEWQVRAIAQPWATSAAVPNENSSAPSSAAITTSCPVFRPPSARSRTRPRRPFSTSVCCASARPSSQLMPAFFIDESGEAPVPPEWPLIRIASAPPLATPAATVPTPASATSLTDTAALGLICLRS